MGSAIRRGKAKGRMHYKKHKIAGCLIITGVIILSGCAKTENMSSIEYDKEQEILAVEIPNLPETGQKLSDFVIDGWELLDSAMMDFNEDGMMDYVGILDEIPEKVEEGGRQKSAPRILFAIESDRPKGYRLSFQDVNLVRTRDEGGDIDDPYSYMLAKKASFTICSAGSNDGLWWAEDYTCTYKEGIWYLTASGYRYERESVIYQGSDNWKTGIGIRQMWKHYLDDVETDGNGEYVEPDMEYELSLDEPLTLYQAGMRGRLAPDRRTEWNVSSIEAVDGVTISKNSVILPKAGMCPDYNDENGILYIFYDGNSENYYLAMYGFENQSLYVVAEGKERMEQASWYKEKIYYVTPVIEKVAYKEAENSVEVIKEKEDVVGMVLNRMNPDGTEQESVFEYSYPKAEQEMLVNGMSNLTLQYEISGDEIVAEVSAGYEEPHLFYRMNLDGSGVRLIGQVPKQ